MTFKDKLVWLQGKQVALCESDNKRFTQVKIFLQHYGIQVVGLNTAKAMQADLESRRYSTHRVFFAVFVSADLARALESPWQEIVKMNPSIQKTPLILTGSPQQMVETADMIEAGYFRYCLTQPISAGDMLRVLGRLNRWKALRGNIQPSATLKDRKPK